MKLGKSINSVLRLANLRLMRASGYARLQEQLASIASSQARSEPTVETDRTRERCLPTYGAKCIEIFGRDIPRGDNCLFWSFDYESPESVQLFGIMYGFKCAQFKKYMDTIKTEKLEGAILEFGVHDGGSLNNIVEKCEQLGLSTPIYGFDSFEGLPAVSQHDVSCFQAGQYAAPLEAVLQTLKCDVRKHVHLVKGWFSETLTSREILADPALRQIAFAHIDCDLYYSAVDCLSFLEGRLTNGAFLIFDDWSFSELFGETKAFFEWSDKVRHLYRFEHVASVERGSLHLRVWLK
ncbi:MAG TPA: TylF/MycF/NovP-related O-methyltransferase [Gemmataceae bacterium]|nr:TylF/MycF/NovP-related O-methyltransferase [Gemmataceae bacterium]